MDDPGLYLPQPTQITLSVSPQRLVGLDSRLSRPVRDVGRRLAVVAGRIARPVGAVGVVGEGRAVVAGAPFEGGAQRGAGPGAVAVRIAVGVGHGVRVQGAEAQAEGAVLADRAVD